MKAMLMRSGGCRSKKYLRYHALACLPQLVWDVGFPTFGRLPHGFVAYCRSAYALGVVIGSPLLVLVTARMDRRRLLVMLALIVLAGNAATALAPSFGTLALARFVSALPHRAYFGVASVAATSMVPREQRASAIARVMVGLAAANVIGVPVTTYLGQTLGWRSALGAIGIGGALLAILILVAVPTIKATDEASPMRELSAFRSLGVFLTLATPAVGFAGMFAIYSYVTPTIMQVTREPAAHVSVFLGLFGFGMVIGNLVGGWLTDRAQTATILGVQAWNVVFFLLFVVAARSVGGMGIVLFLIGMGFAALPAVQARLVDAAPNALSLAAALTNSAFNVANALGAWAGGLAIAAGWGFAATGYVGAIFAFGGLLVFLVAIVVERRSAAGTSE